MTVKGKETRLQRRREEQNASIYLPCSCKQTLQARCFGHSDTEDFPLSVGDKAFNQRRCFGLPTLADATNGMAQGDNLTASTHQVTPAAALSSFAILDNTSAFVLVQLIQGRLIFASAFNRHGTESESRYLFLLNFSTLSC